MTALARLLFPVPDIRRSPATLFAWWERRRLAYNVVVGATGIVTLAELQLLAALPPHITRFDAPLGAIVVYAVCANVCYSFGFLIESSLQRLYGDDVAPVGPTLFRHGLVFSIGLTLFPAGLAALSWIYTIVRYLFG